MNSNKLPLIVGPQPHWPNKDNRDYRSRYAYWRNSLPFVKHSRGVLIHRPRLIATIFVNYDLDPDKPPTNEQERFRRHSFIHYFCGGQSTFDDGQMDFFGEVPNGKVLCERCEFIASVKRGLPTADTICGRHVCIGGVRAFNRCGCPIDHGRGHAEEKGEF